MERGSTQHAMSPRLSRYNVSRRRDVGARQTRHQQWTKTYSLERDELHGYMSSNKRKLGEHCPLVILIRVLTCPPDRNRHEGNE